MSIVIMYIPDALQHLSLVVSVAITEFHQVNVDSFKEVHVPLLYSAQKLMSVQHCTLNVTATVTQTEAAGAQLLSIRLQPGSSTNWKCAESHYAASGEDPAALQSGNRVPAQK